MSAECEIHGCHLVGTEFSGLFCQVCKLEGERDAARKELGSCRRRLENHRNENKALIRQVEELRSGIPDEVKQLRRQLERVQSALARSINRGQVAERERDAAILALNARFGRPA